MSSASPAPPAALPIRVSCFWRASGSLGSGSRASPSSEASDLPLDVLVPVGHGPEDNLPAWPSP